MIACWAEYKDGDPRNLLWAFSFMSYSVPSLLSSVLDSFQKAADIMLTMREECTIRVGTQLFMGVGVLLQISKVGQMRRRFGAVAIDDEYEIKYDEWTEDFEVTERQEKGKDMDKRGGKRKGSTKKGRETM